MITQIIAVGFQSLVDIHLKLGKLTVIVGNTNQGKSALFRALRIMVENRRGDSVINDDMDGCCISIATESNVITWSKKRTKSGEYLKDGVACSQVKALETLKIDEVRLTKQIGIWPNFQDQLASPFLLAETDFQKSKVLGEITNANLLLLSASVVKKKQGDISNKLAWRQSDLTTAKFNRDKVAYVPELVKQLKVAKVSLDSLDKWIDRLDNLIDIEFRLSDEISNIKRLTARYDGLKAFRAKLEAVWPNEILFDRLKLFYKHLEQIEDDIVIASKLKRKMDLASRLPEMGSIENQMFSMAKLEGFVLAIADTNQLERTSGIEAQNAKEELLAIDDEMDKMKDFMKFCPLCEQPLELNAHIGHE